MSLTTIEQALIDATNERFNGRLKAVESLPADWDAKTLERIHRGTPGVFVVFGGGERLEGYGDDTVMLNGGWGLVVATAHASGDLARRRGDTHEIGAYEIIEILAHHFQGFMPDGAAGPMELESVDNLFDTINESKGVALYGLEFRMPTPIVASDGTEPPALDDFLTFAPDYDAAPKDGQLEAEDIVAIPQ